MPLSRLLSTLFSESDTDTPATARTGANGAGDEPSTTERSPTVVYECRTCGTNVSPETDRCPACESEDIVRYSIE